MQKYVLLECVVDEFVAINFDWVHREKKKLWLIALESAGGRYILESRKKRTENFIQVQVNAKES